MRANKNNQHWYFICIHVKNKQHKQIKIEKAPRVCSSAMAPYIGMKCDKEAPLHDLSSDLTMIEFD